MSQTPLAKSRLNAFNITCRTTFLRYDLMLEMCRLVMSANGSGYERG
jgi:hypothetical protein